HLRSRRRRLEIVERANVTAHVGPRRRWLLGNGRTPVVPRSTPLAGSGNRRRNPLHWRAMSKSLDVYRAKRDFSKTPEPAGKKPPAKSGNATTNAYVIQKHA